MNYVSVRITMQELENDNREATRDIDISNIMNWDTGRYYTDPDLQHGCLLSWIENRGVEQHDSALQLISWYLV